MKRALCFLFAAMLIALLVSGCNGQTPSQGETTPETKESASTPADDSTAEETKENTGTGVFMAGYGRADITPEESVPLSGYGRSDQRMSQGFLNYMYTTCVAFTDETGETILMFTSDFVVSPLDITKEGRQMVSASTGVPFDNITVTGTHTHNMIDTSYTQYEAVLMWIKKYKEAMVAAANQAMADRKPAKLSWTTADLEGFNFVRHYFTDLGESVGDNHGSLAVGKLVEHASEANHIMSILIVDREDAKPLLVTNWRSHAHTSGHYSPTFKEISSDFVGYARDYIEKKTDYLFAYYQGDAGNINPFTRLSADIEEGSPLIPKEYGNALAEKILADMEVNPHEEVKTGLVSVVTYDFEGPVNHTMDQYAAIGQELREKWNADGDTSYVLNVGKEYGIESPYHASAIASRSTMAKTVSFPVYATRIGDFAFTNVPLECFDTNGNYVRENSPTKYTFFIGYSNQHNGYLPSQYGYDYGCYESDIGTFQPGTGELLASKLVDMLNELFQK